MRVERAASAAAPAQGPAGPRFAKRGWACRGVHLHPSIPAVAHLERLAAGSLWARRRGERESRSSPPLSLRLPLPLPRPLTLPRSRLRVRLRLLWPRPWLCRRWSLPCCCWPCCHCCCCCPPGNCGPPAGGAGGPASASHGCRSISAAVARSSGTGRSMGSRKSARAAACVGGRRARTRVRGGGLKISRLRSHDAAVASVP
jgi:hypothetical protein